MVELIANGQLKDCDHLGCQPALEAVGAESSGCNTRESEECAYQ